jgi:hypothetical protein
MALTLADGIGRSGTTLRRADDAVKGAIIRSMKGGVTSCLLGKSLLYGG